MKGLLPPRCCCCFLFSFLSAPFFDFHFLLVPLFVLLRVVLVLRRRGCSFRRCRCWCRASLYGSLAVLRCAGSCWGIPVPSYRCMYVVPEVVCSLLREVGFLGLGSIDRVLRRFPRLVRSVVELVDWIAFWCCSGARPRSFRSIRNVEVRSWFRPYRMLIF